MIGFYNRSVILTYVGLGISFYGMTLASVGYFKYALLCLIASGFCDMFDGKIARATKRSEEAAVFGIQIDSLCDAVCFGVFPALIGYFLGVRGVWIVVLALFVTAGIIRLGYFNVMEQKRQQETGGARKFYQGLPITSTAIIFPIWYVFLDAFKLTHQIYLLLIFYVVVGVLFVSPLKVKKPEKVAMIVFFVLAIIVISRLLTA